MLSGHGSDQTGWCLRGQGELAAGITLGLQARAHSDFPYVFLTDQMSEARCIYTLVWPHCDIIWLPFPNIFSSIFKPSKNILSHFLRWNSQDVFRTLQQGRYRDVLGRAWVETSAKIHIEDVGICTAHPLKNGGKGRLLSYIGPIHMLLKKVFVFF